MLRKIKLYGLWDTEQSDKIFNTTLLQKIVGTPQDLFQMFGPFRARKTIFQEKPKDETSQEKK